MLGATRAPSSHPRACWASWARRRASASARRCARPPRTSACVRARSTAAMPRALSLAMSGTGVADFTYEGAPLRSERGHLTLPLYTNALKSSRRALNRSLPVGPGQCVDPTPIVPTFLPCHVPIPGTSELREMISDYGFSRDDVDEDAPQWRRADVNKFLDLFDCSSVEAFRQRFAAERLAQPSKLAPGGGRAGGGSQRAAGAGLTRRHSESVTKPSKSHPQARLGFLRRNQDEALPREAQGGGRQSPHLRLLQAPPTGACLPPSRFRATMARTLLTAYQPRAG